MADNVIVSARSKDKLARLEEDVPNIAAHRLDVVDRDAVQQCVENIEQTSGPIDLAVLNAGAWRMMKTSEMDPEFMQYSMSVNYMGVVHGIKAVLPGMLKRGRGHIAITASVAGYRGLPNSVAYGPTKAALISLAETLNSEVSSKGITVSIINPGFVDTPMTEGNPFPMPQIISASQAAEIILKGLIGGKYEVAFPFRFALMMKTLRLLPNAVYFWVARRLASS